MQQSITARTKPAARNHGLLLADSFGRLSDVGANGVLTTHTCSQIIPYCQPNDQRERPEPAATGLGIHYERNGWLGSAPGCSSVISSLQFQPGGIIRHREAGKGQIFRRRVRRMGLWPSQPLEHVIIRHLLDCIGKLLQDLPRCVGNRALPLVIISDPPSLRQFK